MVEEQAVACAQWLPHVALVNLRIEHPDSALQSGFAPQFALALTANTTTMQGSTRCVWAGPDDWFVYDSSLTAIETPKLVARLAPLVAQRHHALTDVSSGYQVLRLSGLNARELLAQGCPLDLHPNQFKVGACAGTHFFKASVWLWKACEQPTYELLVRSSFVPYVKLMVNKTTGLGSVSK